MAGRDGVVFLDGAAEPDGIGRWSYLATEPTTLLQGEASDWPSAVATIRSQRTQPVESDADLPPLRGGWIGWLSYELGRVFDRQPMPTGSTQSLADFSLGHYRSLLAWDHATGSCWQVGEPLDLRPSGSPVRPRAKTGSTAPVASTFTPAGYAAAVEQVIERILAGDIFQANLSQQFRTRFTGDPVALYGELRRLAAGSHSAFVSRQDTTVLSMSPERFLRYDPGSRLVETRPIKGTRPRDHADADRDAALAAELLASEKDRAENVMIVDLMRNDLHRVSLPDSVDTTTLCALESHAAVHHLVSTVQGRLAPGRDAFDLIAATFPGGSITGAPKLRAMEIIAELEPVRRGVYCGAIGWIGDDGALDLNIAIRTVTLADGMATLGAGGGITALSDPAAEYQETIDKAAALLAALAEAQ